MNYGDIPAADRKWIDKAEQLKPVFAQRARALDEQGGWPEENLNILREEGFHKLAIPREYGGEGTAMTWCTPAASAVIEIIATVCGSTAWALQAQLHSSGLVASMGNEEQRQRILGDSAANGALMASVGSEVRPTVSSSPGHSSGKLTFESELRPVEGGFIANGVKGFSSMGAASKYLLYWALAPGTDDPSVGVTFSVVETSDPGVTFLPGWEDAIGIRSSLSGGAKFENVFIPWANVIGEPGDHMQAHPFTFEITYASLLLGLGEGVFDVVKSTLRERPFLQKDDTNMYRVGEMASSLQATRASHAYAHAVWDSGDYDRAAQATLMALHQAKETTMFVATKAFEVVGVRALFRWNSVERAWRDTRTVTLHTRETQIMRVVAEAEVSGDYFAKHKYGYRIPQEKRVTWNDLGLPRPASM